jgi:hypothetical protein
MTATLGILQKDGTIKKVSQAEFNKYLENHRVGREDVKNLTNTSGKFKDLADVVEVAIDEMFDDEFKEFLSYTTMHKDDDGNLIFNLTSKDMYNLADVAMTYVDCDHFLWSREWEEKNPGKEKAYMYADALKENIFADMSAREFLFLFLTIFTYNGEVTPEKRIEISDWY